MSSAIWDLYTIAEHKERAAHLAIMLSCDHAMTKLLNRCFEVLTLDVISSVFVSAVYRLLNGEYVCVCVLDNLGHAAGFR